jgi:Fe-S cluster biosynthesis and repair protein YggX
MVANQIIMNNQKLLYETNCVLHELSDKIYEKISLSHDASFEYKLYHILMEHKIKLTQTIDRDFLRKEHILIQEKIYSHEN